MAETFTTDVVAERKFIDALNNITKLWHCNSVPSTEINR